MIDRTKTTHPLHKYTKLPKPHKLSLSLSLAVNLDKHKQKLMASMADRSIKREVKAMEAINSVSTKKEVNKGAWTAEEDRKLAEVIAIHGAKRWTTIATKAGLNRCGKSCRLRWLNYLRPNIKRGNISDQEEDLILRLHKLLGNRWSLIAGRLPGRTDNEIKNYWNSHLSKKLRQEEKQSGAATRDGYTVQENREEDKVNEEMSGEENTSKGVDDSKSDFDVDEFFDFSNETTLNLEWVSQFLELDQGFSDVS